ncbi:hypothetical protein CVT26_005287 [Gymnopilus dilepis]|uniref:Uncharacterized protein n=1 Tax=Gymnopilus dilepis TaxID=231916 RepID=A0A409YSV0_9AGAR|nr:hypothetical protein CVT26_005287 [Gymnopilus dilepis]
MSSATREEEPMSARRITSETHEPSDEPDSSLSESHQLERSPTAAVLPAEAADEVKVPGPSASSAHETRHLGLQEILKSLHEILQTMMIQNKETRKQLKRNYIEHQAHRKTMEKERHNMECDMEDRRLERQFREEQERKHLREVSEGWRRDMEDRRLERQFREEQERQHLREVSEGWRRRLTLMNNDLLT